MRILLLEDDIDLAKILATGLRAESYAVDVATTAAQATGHLMTTRYDVACIDLGLPDGDGLALVRQLSGDGDLERPQRIIITTARDAVGDRVAGLDAGADDYPGVLPQKWLRRNSYRPPSLPSRH
jgi:DNA-binding response OmpR family regulator